MRNRRVVWILVCGLFVGLSVAVAGLCWAFGLLGLPDPATADRDGLLGWLVTRDLGQEPHETRVVLARRLEEEFGGQVDWAAVGQSLDGEQGTRLWDNVLVLLEPWFAAKVDGYCRLGESDRPAYVDRTLQLIDNWKGAIALSPASGRAGSAGHQETARVGRDPNAASTAGPTGLVEIVMQRIGRWTQSATPERREQIHGFLLAVQSRQFQRALSGSGAIDALRAMGLRVGD